MIAAFALLAPFVLLMIDQKTEAALGPFPYDRDVFAAAVERSTELGARGVVLKFFMPNAQTERGDRALANAMRKTKVLLQAGGSHDERGPNAFPAKFKLGPAQDYPKAMDATLGAPLPLFANAAYDIGFVDMRQPLNRAPVIEQFEGSYVKSLWTQILELALGAKADIRGDSVAFGNRTLKLGEWSDVDFAYPRQDTIEYIPLVDYLHDRKPRPEVKDRIVIIGADLLRVAPPLQTPMGPLGPHRVFYSALLSMYRSLTGAAESMR
jgi:CHASE2 domain-containing sensor protein